MLGQQPRAHLTHVDLGSLLEHGRAGHIKTLLQPIEPQRLHLLITALHLEWVIGQLGQLLHVLQGGRGTWHLSWGACMARPPPTDPHLAWALRVQALGLALAPRKATWGVGCPQGQALEGPEQDEDLKAERPWSRSTTWEKGSRPFWGPG